jgi:glycosyltransferase involved in cell wall biosynthesis
MSAVPPAGALPFRTVYVTSHVGPHSMHRTLVDSVQAEIGRADHWLRWIDRPRPKWQQYASWLLNGWAFPNRQRYDLFVLEGFQMPPVFMKWMRRIRPDQKVICHHTGEQLYFLQTGFYSKKTDWLMRRIIKSYDAHICVGREQTRLLHEVLDGHPAHVYTVYLAHVSEAKRRHYAGVTPDLGSKRILFVGGIYGGWRIQYKGLDLVIEAFHRALERDPELLLTLIGVTPEVFTQLTREHYPTRTIERIQVLTQASDLAPYFQSHALFLLPGRGDCFPTVVLEAMAAGMVPMVSEFTGNKEVVGEVSDHLVTPIEVGAIADRIGWYFQLDAAERETLSARSRQVASRFSEEAGVRNFRQALQQIHRDLAFSPPGARTVRDIG